MKYAFFKNTLPLLLLSGISISGVASQSDWSGGNGVPGPVTEWTDSFFSDSCVAWGDSLTLNQLLENVVTTDSPPIAAYPADIDSDGDIDIVEIVGGNGGILWWSNLDGTGTSWASYPITSYAQNLTCACISNFDGDGDIDLAGASGIVWWENLSGSGTLWEKHVIATLPAPTFAISTGSGDINGDGQEDVIGSYLAVGEDRYIKWWSISPDESAGSLI